MDKKISTFESVPVGLTLISEEIPFTKVGYGLVKHAPENELAGLVKYAADCLFACGAAYVYIGFQDGADARAAQKLSGDVALRFSHTMIRMVKNIESPAGESGLKMQPVVRGDAELLRGMYNDAFRYVCNAQHYTPEYVKALFNQENHRLQFIVRQNDVIGFCEYVLYEDHILIEAIGIKKQYRGRGLGKSVMHALYDVILNEGMHKAALTVSSANAPAVNLYVKEGFKTQGIRSFWYVVQHAFTF